jgi:hypothetical protein
MVQVDGREAKIGKATGTSSTTCGCRRTNSTSIFKNLGDIFLYHGRARCQQPVPDIDIIELGNEVAHRGNVEDDAAMFELGLLDHVKLGYLFEMLCLLHQQTSGE